MILRAAVVVLLVACGEPALAQSLNASPNATVTTTLQGAATYRGGTITTGGTSQQLMDVNANRHGWNFQNQSTGACWIKIGGVAATNNTSLRVAAGALYETPSNHVSTGAINVTCDLTGAAFYSTEW